MPFRMDDGEPVSITEYIKPEAPAQHTIIDISVKADED